MRGISLIAVLAIVAIAQGANDGRKYIHRRMMVSPIDNPAPSGKVAAGNCGVAPLGQADTKIVGGNEVSPAHSYPWQAALYIDFIYFCGGSVISNEWVLTAGHCLHNANRAKIVLGAHDLSATEASQLEFVSLELFVHADYSPLTIHNDIAVAKFPSPVVFNDFIQPVCLPSYSDVPLPVGTIVTPTGWGLTSDSSTSISNTLNFVNVPVVSQQTCINTYGNLVVYDGNVCIDSTGGHGTCSGDSGGPLNYVPVAGGPTFTRGITSYGSSAGCESGAPDAFTRVIYFLDWIEATTGIVIDP